MKQDAKWGMIERVPVYLLIFWAVVRAVVQQEDSVMVFSDIVDAAEGLSPDEQLALVGILQRRIAEKNRQAMLQDIAESREAFDKGDCQSATAREIMDEIQP